MACSARAAGVRRVEAGEVRFSLSERARDVLADEPGLRAELEQALVELFGDPQRPRFAGLDLLDQHGFDPDSAPMAGTRPAAELEGARPEILRADNRRAWAAELEAVQRGELDHIGPFSGRLRMTRQWGALLERRAELGEDELARRAERFFVERVPDLAEAGDLFRGFCARCHGLQGGGDGPMAERLFPRPRDYRLGLFKFASVESGSKPRRLDLIRTLLNGLPGSAMPSWRALPLAEISALADYARLLAMRGETERMLLYEWEAQERRPRETAGEVYALVWERWLAAIDGAPVVAAPPPDPAPARWAVGRALFLDQAGGNCVSCHGAEGRGDGERALRVDADGGRFALLQDAWGNYLLPRDLTSGVFRGGGEREDIYRRIHCGVPGTPMPSLGTSTGATGAPLLSEEERWALVDYVLSLSGRGPLAR